MVRGVKERNSAEDTRSPQIHADPAPVAAQCDSWITSPPSETLSASVAVALIPFA